MTTFTTLTGTNTEHLGAKATNLQRVHELGLPIPLTLALDPDQARDAAGHDSFLVNDLMVWAWGSNHQVARVADRSSPPYSMPGILTTVLDVPCTFPEVLDAIAEVNASWDNPAAVAYRNRLGEPHDFALGVIVQEYVTPGPDTYAGVMLTRDPRTGREPVIEAVQGASGKQIVDGTTTTFLELPVEVAHALHVVGYCLERAQRAPQDVEFVYVNGEVIVLQTRRLRMATPEAARTVAAAMLRSGMITERDVPGLLPEHEARHQWWSFVQAPYSPALLQGQGVMPGAFTGRLAIGKDFGPDAIYVGDDTDAQHMEAMLQCGAVLTARGGRTSHAAMTAMNSGAPTVVGAGFTLNPDGYSVSNRQGLRFIHGQVYTLDGGSGQVWGGQWPHGDRREAK